MQTIQLAGMSRAGKGNKQTVTIRQLQKVTDRIGPDGFGNEDQVLNRDIMLGRWSYRFRKDGVSVHGGSVTELENVTATVEVPPGLSINILFAGEVNFGLCGKEYVLGRKFKPVECAAYALDRTEILNRYFRKGQFVRKINIFVSKSWLDTQVHTQVSREQFHNLFQRHAAVVQWRPSAAIQKLAVDLLDHIPEDNLTGALQIEGESLRLVSHCIGDLCALRGRQEGRFNDHLCAATTLSRSGQLTQKIRDALGQPDLSVEQVAAVCNMSISTLQRRVRSVYGMTVSECIRSIRLEKARAAMIRDGLSVGEAAELAGYQHTSNFIAAFKKRFSMTPAMYRKSHLVGRPAGLVV